MDQILQSVLKSDKTEAQKKGMVKKILNAGSQNNSVASILNIFQTTVHIMLDWDDELSIQAARDVFIGWAKSNRATLADYLAPHLVAKFMEQRCKNPGNISYLLLHSFKMLSGSYPQCLAPLEFVIEAKAITFVDHNNSFSSFYQFCALLLEFKHCIPQSTETAKFCGAVLLATTYIDMSSQPMSNAPKMIQRVNQYIGGLLGHIWSRSDAETIMICLKTVFDIIRTDDEGREKAPSVALAGLVQHIPSDYIEEASKKVTSDHSIPDSNLELALDRMMMWLQWPNAKNIELWIVAFLRGLKASHKYTILINITEHCVEKVADRFPGLISQIRRELHDLDPQHQDTSQAILFKIAELLQCLIHLHPGFPDIYEPLLKEIQDFPKISAEAIQTRIAQNKWGSQHKHGERVSSISKWLRKSETGKIGLLNLGNTCFTNSVLQALFMCDSFRQDVLRSTPGPSQLVLVKLQYVFAFLSASNRAFFSPSNFLNASRPPWFTIGHQQDCSEFLRYLLDLLHEQEVPRKRLEKRNEKKGGLLSSLKSNQSDKTVGIKSEDFNPSLGERTFGGKIVNTYTCLNCKTQSSRCEGFNDIALPFPEDSVHAIARRSQRKAAAALTSSSSSQSLNNGKNSANGQDAKTSIPLLLQDLLANYLKPEKLEGDNKYHCDNCKTLQDAERTLNITHSPEYLILTLLRFSFDVKTQSRSKIFTEVKYPKTLYVPLSEDTSSQVSPTTTSKKSRKKSPPVSSSSSPTHPLEPVLGSEKMEVYALSAVIVHSGISSDGGHYYCYARHSTTIDEAQNQQLNSDVSVDMGDIDYLQDKWYLFNDSRVTYSSYSSFSDITQKFAKDTAYVLIYKKIHAGDIRTVDANMSIQTSVIDYPLRRDLREAVDRDNKQYIQEQEYEERRRQASKKRESSAWFWKDSDDQGPPGSCGGGGGFGLHQGPSFVF